MKSVSRITLTIGVLGLGILTAVMMDAMLTSDSRAEDVAPLPKPEERPSLLGSSTALSSPIYPESPRPRPRRTSPRKVAAATPTTPDEPVPAPEPTARPVSRKAAPAPAPTPEPPPEPAPPPEPEPQAVATAVPPPPPPQEAPAAPASADVIEPAPTGDSPDAIDGEVVAVEEAAPPVVEESPEQQAPGQQVIKRDGWMITPLKVWGFNDAMRKYNIESIYGREFYARRDQVLTGARLVLDLEDSSAATLPQDILSLDISLNGEKVASISRQELLTGVRHREIVFDSHLLGEENMFVLTFKPYWNSPCQPIVEAGTWNIIKKGSLDTRSEQLPLPNDLGLLPIPFFDQRTDREPAVTILMLDAPSMPMLRAASMVASYFGLHAGSGGVRFPMFMGQLPAGHAVVLMSGNSDLQRSLRLPSPEGPVVRMIDHPGAGQKNYKLLVIQGRDPSELEVAARHFASIVWGTEAYKGELMRFSTVQGVEQAAPQSLPHWFLTRETTTFAEILGSKGTLEHRGHAGNTLQLEFRISPELLSKPSEYLIMDVQYAQQIPAPYTPPKLDVEFNGIFLKTLYPWGGGLQMEYHKEQLFLPRSQLRGVNRLQFHISAVQHQPLCTTNSGKFIDNSISGESSLRLMGDTELVHLPDVESFLYNGLPFSLKGDLSSTLVVLPADPAPREIGTALSAISNLAGATGRLGDRIEFVPDYALQGPMDLDRNILFVSVVGHSPLLAQWSDRLPLSTTGERLRVRLPTSSESFLEALRARQPNQQARLVAEFLAGAENPGVVMEMESPLHRGRSAIVITADAAENLPAVIDLQGYTEARMSDGGDLLLLEGEKRAIFRIGRSYADKEASRWKFLLWIFGEHWLILFPIVLIAALILALVLRSWLRHREQVRLELLDRLE